MEERYVIELIERGDRVDGRKFTQFRDIVIEKNVIEKAEGSASVKIGETHVIAGVKIGTGEPFSDSPNEGILIVNTEFTPLASPDFESGPPGEDAVELARVIDRGIRESKCIEMGKLCITEGEKVWSVFVDIHIINHQGNLLNAAALASLVALMNTKIPKLEDGKIVRVAERELPVVHKPITVTVGKIGNNFILDPSLQEENVLEAKLSVAIREDGKICALQKQGRSGLTLEEIEKMVDIAIEKSEELRKLV